MSAITKIKMTEEEYLAKERVAEFRSEFYNGEMFAMSGASWNHNQIKNNIEGELYSKFKGGPCKAVSSDQRIKVNKSGLYTYPDIAIICEKPEFSAKDPNTLVNPQVIIEILSPSTASYDRIEKFDHFKRLPFFREYLLIEQDRVAIERYEKKSNGEWVIEVFTAAHESLPFATLPVEIKMSDIYAGVEFPDLLEKPQIFREENTPHP